MKQTWTTINGILNRRKKKKDFPKCFQINNVDIYDNKIIANEFNKCFIDIDPNLQKTSKSQVTKHTKII